LFRITRTLATFFVQFGLQYCAVQADFPAQGCSRKLMQRRKVLLPEPDEPMMLIITPPWP
jgi:hypothetical protein